jgi:hypothetical protein
MRHDNIQDLFTNAVVKDDQCGPRHYWAMYGRVRPIPICLELGKTITPL